MVVGMVISAIVPATLAFAIANGVAIGKPALLIATSSRRAIVATSTLSTVAESNSVRGVLCTQVAFPAIEITGEVDVEWVPIAEARHLGLLAAILRGIRSALPLTRLVAALAQNNRFTFNLNKLSKAPCGVWVRLQADPEYTRQAEVVAILREF
jgi:hypothetical protein